MNHFSNSFFSTIQALATRPGHAIREYLNDQRAGFGPALTFLFWTVAIAVALMWWLDLDQAIFQPMNEHFEGENGMGNSVGGAINGKIVNNLGLLILLMLPGTTLGTFLLFRSKSYSFQKIFILSSYLTCAVLLMGIINAVVFKVFGANSGITMAFSALGYAAWLLYFAWGYRQFFKDKNYWSVLLKTGLILLLGLLVFLLMTVVVSLLIIQ